MRFEGGRQLLTTQYTIYMLDAALVVSALVMWLVAFFRGMKKGLGFIAYLDHVLYHCSSKRPRVYGLSDIGCSYRGPSTWPRDTFSCRN